jgi:hypothetical protein
MLGFITEPIKSCADGDPPTGRKSNPKTYLVLLLLAIGVIFAGREIIAGDENNSSPTVVDDEGNIILSPERQAKLEKELHEIDNAAQYVISASVDGYYPCFTCPDGSPTIFLYEGEIWRYGVTRKGEKGRYPGGNYGAPELFYAEEFRGTYSECLKMEKIKIYNYPLLPEAQKRKIKLFRPPGNANDS